MRMSFNKAIACKNCSKLQMKRSEPLFRLAVLVTFISGLLVLPAARTDQMPSWVPDWIVAPLFLSFIIGFVLCFYYEYWDRKRSYACRECGHAETVQAPPLSFMERVFVFSIVGFVALLFIGIGALVVSFKVNGG